jgi:hypothetical protein
MNDLFKPAYQDLSHFDLMMIEFSVPNAFHPSLKNRLLNALLPAASTQIFISKSYSPWLLLFP